MAIAHSTALTEAADARRVVAGIATPTLHAMLDLLLPAVRCGDARQATWRAVGLIRDELARRGEQG